MDYKFNDPSTTEIINIDMNSSVAKAGIAVGGAVTSVVTLNTLISVATLIFVLLQIGLLIPKYVQAYRAWREGRKIKVDLK